MTESDGRWRRVEPEERIVRRHSTVSRRRRRRAHPSLFRCDAGAVTRGHGFRTVGPQMELCELVCRYFVWERLWIGTTRLVMD